jgi:hypothetical protein
MRRSLAFSSLSLVMFMSPADARCYSRWYYPYPQKCNADVAKLVNAEGLKPSGISLRVQPPPSAPIIDDDDPNDHSWYVEIIKLPPDNETEARDAGISVLKGLMNK